MVNATAMAVNAGWQYLNSTTNFSIPKAALAGWQTSAHGIAAVLVFSFLILMGMTIVYIRTNRFIPAAFAGLILILVENYYHFLEMPAYKWSASMILGGIIVILVIGIAVEVYKYWTDR